MKIEIVRLGRMAYPEALDIQEKLLARRQAGLIGDTLLLVEHPPVLTIGRRGSDANIRVPREQLAARGVSVYPVNRGGDVTYHGPGQVVGYPIVDLEATERDLHRYLRMLEKVLLDTVACFAVNARTVEGRTGIWAGEKKLASIGVGVRRWVSWHGFALNVGDDLCGFETIGTGLPLIR